MYGDDGWQWCRIRGGPARGSWIQAQPRTHKFQIAGTYEPAIVQALGAHPVGSVAWDVGAHIGYFVLVAGRLGHHVVAVEPNPENVSRIRATLARNELEATVVEAAVGASAGVAYLNRAAESSMSRISSAGTPVEMTTLDALYEKAEDLPPAVVKIDVEGLEVDVLRGGARLVDEVRPAFVIELHDRAYRDPIARILDTYHLRYLPSGHLVARPR